MTWTIEWREPPCEWATLHQHIRYGTVEAALAAVNLCQQKDMESGMHTILYRLHNSLTGQVIFL